MNTKDHAFHTAVTDACFIFLKAAQNAWKLLKNNGLIVAEELIRDYPPTQTIQWYFDRFDPLVAAKLIDPLETIASGHFGPDPREQEHQGHSHAHEHHGHGHGHEHGHGHGHSHGGPEQQLQRMNEFADSSKPATERWNVFYNATHGLPEKKELVESIVNVFGTANTRVVDTLPFIYHHYVFCGQVFYISNYS